SWSLRAAAADPPGRLISMAAHPITRKPASEAATPSTPRHDPRRPSDLECEPDGQEAVKQGRKGYISAKTILTPSADDAAVARAGGVGNGIGPRFGLSSSEVHERGRRSSTERAGKCEPAALRVHVYPLG